MEIYDGYDEHIDLVKKNLHKKDEEYKSNLLLIILWRLKKTLLNSKIAYPLSVIQPIEKWIDSLIKTIESKNYNSFVDLTFDEIEQIIFQYDNNCDFPYTSALETLIGILKEISSVIPVISTDTCVNLFNYLIDLSVSSEDIEEGLSNIQLFKNECKIQIELLNLKDIKSIIGKNDFPLIGQ